MTTYEWRQSGCDAKQHAFPADAGFIDSIDMVAVFEPRLREPSEFFGPYEAYRAECGQITPVAMLLPTSTGDLCTSCQVTTGQLLPTLKRWKTALPPDANNILATASG